MNLKNKRLTTKLKRKKRIRKKVSGTSTRPRLSIFRSLKYIYVQAIDDVNGTTIASGSTNSKKLKEKVRGSKNIKAAEMLGETIGEDMARKGIKTIVFDRNGYLYHGKIKALADKVREKGINF